MTSISYSKVVLSVGMIVFVAAMVVAGTGAFFNDTETSTGNTFTAGALDLTVDSVGHVNGLVCFNNAWHPEGVVAWNETDEVLELNTDQAGVDAAVLAYNTANPSNVPQAGDDCASTWALTDLGAQTFFQFADLKPGDEGENTISLHVENNDAYACIIIDNMQDDEVEPSCTEPEAEDGDVTCSTAPNNGEGELAQELRFFAWDDDGDNIWEAGEEVLFSNTEGPASDVLGGVVYPLYTPLTGALAGAETQYVGLYWCYGDITVGTNTLECDGSAVTNLSQTDSLMADFTFYVEQARNNEGFECPALTVPAPETGTLTLLKTVVDTDTVPDEPADTAWSLEAAGPVTVSGAEGAGAVTSAVVLAGDYTLSELNIVAGYTQTGLECSGNGGVLALAGGNTVTVAAGDAVTCTFTNTEDIVTNG